MLIIEVDGITHHFETQISKDKKRQFDLETNGFTVLRFQDDEILKNIEGVRMQISMTIQKIKHPPP